MNIETAFYIENKHRISSCVEFVIVHPKYWTFVIDNDVGNANTTVFVYLVHATKCV